MSNDLPEVYRNGKYGVESFFPSVMYYKDWFYSDEKAHTPNRVVRHLRDY